MRRKLNEKIYTFNSLKFCLCLGQFFGVLPQEGITSFCTKNELRFKWCSVRVIYSLLVLCVIISALILACVQSITSGIGFAQIVTTVFYLLGALVLIFYLHIARSNFIELIRFWCKVDDKMNEYYGFPKQLKLRIGLLTGLLMLFTLGDIVFGAVFHFTHSRDYYDVNYFKEKFYFKNTYPEIVYHGNLHLLKRMVATTAACLCTLILEYNDLFIISISTALSLRFRQISKELDTHKKRLHSSNYYTSIRENYTLLAILCRRVDDHISRVVLLSFTNNFFLVLIQIYYSMRTLHGSIESIYFFYSFSHIMGRLVLVCLYGAWINDESKKPAEILNALAITTYNIDVQRLLFLISLDDVALTGSKLFKITRGLILNVAKAVVTYELALIQLNVQQ